MLLRFPRRKAVIILYIIIIYKSVIKENNNYYKLTIAYIIYRYVYDKLT